MAYTLRPTDEQKSLIRQVKKLTQQKTASQAIFSALEQMTMMNKSYAELTMNSNEFHQALLEIINKDQLSNDQKIEMIKDLINE